MFSFSETVKRSRAEFETGQHSKALKILGDIPLGDKDAGYLEGSIFNDLRLKSGNILDQMITFLLASVESYSRIPQYPYCTSTALFDVAERFGSFLYYKRARKEAKLALDSVIDSEREALNLIIGLACKIISLLASKPLKEQNLKSGNM